MLPEELFLSLCRLQCPRPQLVLLGSRVLGAVQPTLAWGALLGPGRRRPSHAQSCMPTKENTLGVGFRRPSPPATQQVPGSQRQPGPALPDGERRALCENGLHCFPDQRLGLGLFVLCEERFLPLCRLQPPGARLVQLGRCGLGSQRPSLPRGSLLWIGLRRFCTPNPESPRRRTHWECLSGSGEPQQSSRAQGARGSPAQLCPTSSGGLGA